MKRILLLAVFAVSFLCRVSAESKVYEVKSPDKKISFSFKVDDNQQIIYKVAVKGNNVIDWSETGFSYGLEEAPVKVAQIHMKTKKPQKHKGEYRPVWGKRSVVKDVYNSWMAVLNTESEKMECFEVRVYNDGIAFNNSFIDLDEPSCYEHTEFNFAADYTAWYYNGERHNIGPEKLSDASGERLPLMTIKAAD